MPKQPKQPKVPVSRPKGNSGDQKIPKARPQKGDMNSPGLPKTGQEK